MLVFQLNKQFQHHWGVSALFRWFLLKTQARRNACRLEQQLMEVKSVFRSLLFWFITLCWRKRTWLGTGRGFAAFTAIAMGSAAAGLWLEFTWLSGSTGETSNDARSWLRVCYLALFMSMKHRKSFGSDFSLSCWSQELVAPSWVMDMLYVVCFLLTFLKYLSWGVVWGAFGPTQPGCFAVMSWTVAWRLSISTSVCNCALCWKTSRG